jgi:sugar phosphate isomerase/epimerase/type 1 glutamine amidotransferase
MLGAAAVTVMPGHAWAQANSETDVRDRERYQREAEEARQRLISSADLDPAARSAIDTSLPDETPATPGQGRKLLIFDVNVGYPGHPSRFHANYAFERMGEKTGAFEVVLSRDPEVFRRESLSRFDAVFLNNTVGNLFEDRELRRNLVEFVYGGGGLMGVHGTTVAFTQWPGAVEDWPEFGVMLGGRGARHREFDERVFTKIDSPNHPLVRVFPSEGFEYRDEFFRVHGPYSRDRVRVLFSIDVDKTDLTSKERRWKQEREDNDYALSWIRNYGRGRVFYCTIAHNPEVFRDPRMLKFYLAATQFVLGDLPASTVPSDRLTPAISAQEKLGWRLGVTAYTFHRYTLFETIEKTEQLGLLYLGGLSFQKVGKDIDKPFDANLNDAELKAIRLKLDEAGVRMPTCYYANIPADEEGCRQVFEFARKMGIETLISEPPLESLDMMERFCDEYDIDLAIHNHDPKASPHYWSPEAVMKVCKGRGPHIGVCADVGYWMRSGIDHVAAIKTIGSRLFVVQLHDLNALTSEGHDVPWGTGEGRTEAFLTELHRQGVHPKMIGLEYSYDWYDSMPEAAQCVHFFNETTKELAKVEE